MAQRHTANPSQRSTRSNKTPPKSPAPTPSQAAGTGAPPAREAGAATFRAKVRMYRQGLGDFFLLTLPRTGVGQKDFHMLIDCGVIVGTANATESMKTLVEQLGKDVGNALDVVVATHRHADHVSGFLQAADVFKNFAVGEVWVSWIENPDDPIGRQLLEGHEKAETALRASAQRLRAVGMTAVADEVSSLLDFRGEQELGVKGSTTLQAMQNAKSLGKQPLRYCRPDDPPKRFSDIAANFFVFGPPRDLKLLGQMDPSKSSPETYGISAIRSLVRDIAPPPDENKEKGSFHAETYGITAIRSLVRDIGPALDDNKDESPFDANWTIPLDRNDALPFFQTHYFDGLSDWRRIDDAWVAGSSALALAFDQAVNNTSLVLAIELDGGGVLLFAADAQVGNWLSWQGLKWNPPGRGEVTAPDLVKRTIFYKVGHHASHNATLREKGLEAMEQLHTAMISVDETMAHKKNWGQMPFGALLSALDERTGGRSIRADKNVPTQLGAAELVQGNGYYELIL